MAQVIDTIAVGNNPCGMVIDGSILYVANNGSNTVSRINTTTKKTRTVTVGNGPTRMVMIGENLYVINNFDNTISIVDTTTMVETTVFAGPSGMNDIADGLDGVHICVDDMAALSAIDITASPPTVAGSVKLGKSPGFLALSADGDTACVAHLAESVVFVIRGGLLFPTVRRIAVREPALGTAISPDGNRVYVSHLGTMTAADPCPISAIDLTSGAITMVTVGRNPMDITLSPDGTRLYVANICEDTISIVDTTTDQVVDTVRVGMHPGHVAVNGDGTRVFVSNIGDHTVSVIEG